MQVEGDGLDTVAFHSGDILVVRRKRETTMGFFAGEWLKGAKTRIGGHARNGPQSLFGATWLGTTTGQVGPGAVRPDGRLPEEHVAGELEMLDDRPRCETERNVVPSIGASRQERACLPQARLDVEHELVRRDRSVLRRHAVNITQERRENKSPVAAHDNPG